MATRVQVKVKVGRDNAGRLTLSYALRQEWRVTFSVRHVATGCVVERLVLEPAGECPPGGITAALLRAPSLRPVRAYAPRTVPTRRRPIRAPRVDYKNLHARYMALLRAGVQDIDKALARELGKSRGTIRSQLHRARAAGVFDQAVQASPIVVTLPKRQMATFRRTARNSARR